MNFKIHKLLSKIQNKLSVKLFNQRLPFAYLLFNYFYRKIIINKQTLKDKDILDFHNLGYVKLNVDFSECIKKYKNSFFLKKNNDLKKKLLLDLNDKDKYNFVLDIKKKLLPELKKYETYFNCNLVISEIRAFRNYYHKDKNSLKIEHYANHFHQDGYIMTLNKIFVNLMNIFEDDGPLELVPLNNRARFVKNSNYKDRNNYNLNFDKSLIVKNTGNIGSALMFSSSQIFHRAGVPKNYRDTLQIILINVPKNKNIKLDNFDYKKLYSDNLKDFSKLSKPYNIFNILNLFFNFYKNKKIFRND